MALQAGITDANLKKILRELYEQNKLTEEDFQLSESDVVQFFNPDQALDETIRLWRTMIEENFPVHVFALDPQVDEQNVYDAFNRRREMQLALAISVTRGRMALNQRLALSRQLALDISTIDLNRTVVAFSHDNDTFGWYFRPRVQAPPTESTNVGAFARTLWSTGPTECYDLRNRELEPGMRECEVLIVMPSFVTQVDFDVTTNWEKLARPGVTKRSYEEMIALGRRIHELRSGMCQVCDQDCFRPGDYERLMSRVEQLEKMLGMQTQTVNVPYEYEVSGTDLFDTGDVHLRPVLYDYYGLNFVEAGSELDAHVFLTGKNFHPSLTHVIVGGSESHTLTSATATPEVEVINRGLLQVKIKKLNDKLSDDGQFTVRVGTPSGLSDPLIIKSKPAKSTTKTGFDLKKATVWNAVVCDGCNFKGAQHGFGFTTGLATTLPLKYEPANQPLLPPVPGQQQAWAVARLTAKDSDGKEVKFSTPRGEESSVDTERLEFVLDKLEIPLNIMDRMGDPVEDDLQSKIEEALQKYPPLNHGKAFEISVDVYVKFSDWPAEKLLSPIKIKVDALTVCDDCNVAATGPPSPLSSNSTTTWSGSSTDERSQMQETIPHPSEENASIERVPIEVRSGGEISTSPQFKIRQPGPPR